jgi:hypothetical protein
MRRQGINITRLHVLNNPRSEKAARERVGINFRQRSVRRAQTPLEETIDLFIRLRGGRMPLASGQDNAIVEAKQLVHRNRVIESRPASRSGNAIPFSRSFPRQEPALTPFTITS